MDVQLYQSVLEIISTRVSSHIIYTVQLYLLHVCMYVLQCFLVPYGYYTIPCPSSRDRTKIATLITISSRVLQKCQRTCHKHTPPVWSGTCPVASHVHGGHYIAPVPTWLVLYICDNVRPPAESKRSAGLWFYFYLFHAYSFLTSFFSFCEYTRIVVEFKICSLQVLL